ncbi:MAG: TetR family transcriptional regulator [Hyphomicrobiales bacterium]|nr:MAG: TetR family transcriptional regulator [Hyphomicrobiales bacterium]
MSEALATIQPQTSEADFSKRQQEVLSAVLELMVREGGALTMERVAKSASCSKETLYKWFGDRQGLLTATVQWQASKVRIAPIDGSTLDEATLRDALIRFASDWLAVLTSDVSIALNRMAISQGGSASSDLGSIVLQNGPFAMRRRLLPVLVMGRDAGHLEFKSGAEAFSCFFGLVVRDIQIRVLLGEDVSLNEAQIKTEAKKATEQFFALYGEKKT